MPLSESVPFSPGREGQLESFPAGPAVFAIHLRGAQGEATQPYLGRTRDLRRRLARLLRPPEGASKRLNLGDVALGISYQIVGSQFEALWWLYQLHREHYPRTYRQRLRLKSPVFLKIQLGNRFPRCFPTRRISGDGSEYFGPFASRPAAERFASAFLDLFKIRRCVEDLEPDPSHPGCIYSQMHMCLAPCFAGCTDVEYHKEVDEVRAALNEEDGPRGLLAALEASRARASDLQEFEEAARQHRRVEKAQELTRLWPDIARNLSRLHALVIERGAEPKSVVFFRIHGGEIRGPVSLPLEENVASPVSLDQQLHDALAPLAASAAPEALSGTVAGEHLSLLARWYYSSFRTGEILMLNAKAEIPHKRLIRLCRKIALAG